MQQIQPTTEGVNKINLQSNFTLFNLPITGSIEANKAFNNINVNAVEIIGVNPLPNTIYTVKAKDQTRQFYSDGIILQICNVFTCDCCKKEKYYISDFTTGYGTNKDGLKLCYDCIAKEDIATLLNAPNGYIKTIALYYDSVKNTIANWPNSISFPTVNNTTGYHNIARKQYNFDFKVGDCYFHGTVYGDNTQIASVRKLKLKH